MPLDRRTFLRSSAALAGLHWAGCAAAPLAPPEPNPVFQHGIASGDPLTDRVVLWTRITRPLNAQRHVPVQWRVAADPRMQTEIAGGSVVAGPVRDYAVKIDVDGLAPGRTYYYAFAAAGWRSPVGRTRTLPVGSPDRLRLAFCSCSNIAWGHFNPYAHLARRPDLDAVLHLGDYLYEYANGTYGDGTLLGRIPEPDKECVTLSDYRVRHAQYKRDPDLQEAHRQHAFITIWDDHELADNAWREGAANHQAAAEGSWNERWRSAVRAYFEWMPIREPTLDRPRRLWRHFRFGDLAELMMLETRLARDAQVDPEDLARLADPQRSLLGLDQERWLMRRLSQSQGDGIAWRVLGQPSVMSPLWTPEGRIHNPDSWDGYPEARRRLFDHLLRGGIRDNVVLTGDVHSSWAMDVAPDPYQPALYDPITGRGSVGVEFVTPGVSSPGVQDPVEAARREEEVRARQPHVRWVELHHRGYALLDIDRDRAQCEWYHVDGVEERSSQARLARAFRSWRGHDHLEPVETASEPSRTASPLAP